MQFVGLAQLTCGRKKSIMSKITFRVKDETQYEIFSDYHPVPASKMIPKWYKDIPNMADDHRGYKDIQTVKRCVPYLDAMTTGYIIPLSSDVGLIFDSNTNKFEFVDHQGKNINQITSHQTQQVPYNPYYDKYPHSKHILKWHNPWYIETPPGWSCLFTSPFNHFETRFKIIDGIVDTDRWNQEINFPFMWTGNDMSNDPQIIKRGTPMIQVIPFKREELELDVSYVKKDEQKEIDISQGKWSLARQDYYREESWHKSPKNKNMPD